MKQDLFSYLPSEISIDILSRLPLQTILSCKCVCKWLHDLVDTLEFAQFHLSKSKSLSGLAVTVVPHCNIGKTTELTQNLQFSTIITFSFIDHHYAWIEGSADGLLLLRTMEGEFHERTELYLCNPITREYINLRHHTQPFAPPEQVMIYGFGVSNISGQYKAVSICMVQTICECKVYTIGTGCWRSIAPQPYYSHTERKAVFVNGNLHWVVVDINQGSPLIFCFDLETELFTTFSVPYEMSSIRSVVVAAAEDCLCLCDGKSSRDLVSIWKMKEYGNEKSWTKEFVIADTWFRFIEPIKEVVLMADSGDLNYFVDNKTNQKTCSSWWRLYLSAVAHTPSLVSLKCFRTETTFSF